MRNSLLLLKLQTQSVIVVGNIFSVTFVNESPCPSQMLGWFHCIDTMTSHATLECLGLVWSTALYKAKIDEPVHQQ